MKLSEVQSVEKVVHVQFMDHDVEVSYRPARMTPQVLENVMEAAAATGEDERGAMAVIGSMLEPVLAWWDVLDDNDQRMPTNADTIKGMPLAFLMAVLTKVQEDQRPPDSRG
jgi:hypothetical protein